MAESVRNTTCLSCEKHMEFNDDQWDRWKDSGGVECAHCGESIKFVGSPVAPSFPVIIDANGRLCYWQIPDTDVEEILEHWAEHHDRSYA